MRGKGNPIEKMCAAKEILLKNVRGKGNPIEKCARQKEILLKSWKKTSQSEPHPSPRPRDPWKSWKKPHNLRTIPWTSGNPGKNLTICGPSPGPRKSWKKTSQLYYGFACWLLSWLLSSNKLCRGPLRGQKCAVSPGMAAKKT